MDVIIKVKIVLLVELRGDHEMQANEYNKMVAVNLKFLREERNMTMQHLADTCGNIAKSLIGKIEKNIHEEVHSNKISSEVITSLEKGLPGVAPKALTSGDKELWARIEQVEKLLASNNLEMIFKTDRLEDTIFSILSVASGCGPRERTRAFLIRGEYEYMRGNYKLALLYSSFGMRSVEKLDDQYLEHRARFMNAKSLHMNGENKQAQEILRIDLKKWYDRNDNAKSLYLKGLTHAKLREFEEAIEDFQTACDIFKQNDKMVLFEGRCYQCLGGAFLDTGDFDKSIIHSEAALQIARTHSDLISEIYILKTIGEAWDGRGNAETAALYFEEALNKAHTIGSIRKLEIVKLEYSLGKCRKDYDRMKNAVLSMNAAQFPDQELVDVLLDMVEVAREHNLIDDAFHFYEIAIQILRK